MAKYASNTVDTRTAALKTGGPQVTQTFEGAPAYAKDAKTELFTLAVTSMTNEKSFYESAGGRDSRLRNLVAQLVQEDPEWLQRLIPWVRKTANMRSSSIVLAAEYALAGGPNKRQVIDSAMLRADEPAEFVGYWITRTGKPTLPGGVQRGVADAVTRLYHEYGALKYDSSRHAVRMADVIELTHPKASAARQNDLFKYLLDDRHHGDAKATPRLNVINARQTLQSIPEDERRKFIRTAGSAELLDTAGVTWEFLSGWLPGGMDAEAWEEAIPHMGYMALLRNLRNFDEAGISEKSVSYVQSLLSDPVRVAKSRQFPYRFWSAWNATQSLKWGESLEKALELSTKNIPEFSGKTLILVDVSGSMGSARPSRKSNVTASDIAGLFAAALYAKAPKDTRVVLFGTNAVEATPKQTGAMLRNMETFRTNPGIGYGTNIRSAAVYGYNGEDRMVVITDMQAHDGGVGGFAPFTHYFDLGGFSNSPDGIGKDGVYMYSGFTDATFRQMPLHEATRKSSWDDIFK